MHHKLPGFLSDSIGRSLRNTRHERPAKLRVSRAQRRSPSRARQRKINNFKSFLIYLESLKR